MLLSLGALSASSWLRARPPELVRGDGMSGYTPVFRSVFTGSLCGQWPDTAAWLCLLALADRHGVVDMTPQYIASVTGMPLAELTACIERFLQPDPMSRSAASGGRRLELLDPSRPWGWRIINFAHYREKARLAAKNAREVESGSNKERMGARPPLTAADRLGPPSTDPSDADKDSDKDSKKATFVAAGPEQAVDNSAAPKTTAEAREEGKRLWPRVLAAIQHAELRKAFPPDSDVGRAINALGGWQKLGLKKRDLRGQTEQHFLNSYAEIAAVPRGTNPE